MPHEAIHAEVGRDPTVLARASEDHSGEAWWATLQESPIKQKAGDEPVVPIAMYLEGVKYSNSDGVTSIWF